MTRIKNQGHDLAARPLLTGTGSAHASAQLHAIHLTSGSPDLREPPVVAPQFFKVCDNNRVVLGRRHGDLPGSRAGADLPRAIGLLPLSDGTWCAWHVPRMSLRDAPGQRTCLSVRC